MDIKLNDCPINSSILSNIALDENINPNRVIVYFECKNLKEIYETKYNNKISSEYFVKYLANKDSGKDSFVIQYYTRDKSPVLIVGTTMSRYEPFYKIKNKMKRYFILARRKFSKLYGWKSFMKCHSYVCKCQCTFPTKSMLFSHIRYHCRHKDVSLDNSIFHKYPDLQDDRELRKNKCCFDKSCTCYQHSYPHFDNINLKSLICNTLSRGAHDFTDINHRLYSMQSKSDIVFILNE